MRKRRSVLCLCPYLCKEWNLDRHLCQFSVAILDIARDVVARHVGGLSREWSGAE